MSVTQATRFGAPSAGVTSSMSLVAPFADVDVDAFRGYFLPLVDSGNAMTKAYIGSAFPNGTIKFGISKYKDDSGDRRTGVSSGGGMYGEDALEIIYDHWLCTFDSDNNRINATGHGIVDGDIVTFTRYDRITDTLPTGLTPATGIDAGTKYYAINVVEGVSFQVSASAPPSTVVQEFTTNGSNPSGGDFGVFSQTGLPGFWIGMQRSNNPSSASFYETGSGKHPGDPAKGPYNRFEYLVKHPAGYRAQFMTKLQAGKAIAPYHDAINFGTYHGSFDFNGQEEGNNHFYFQFWPRYDLASGQWMRVKLAERPSNERSSPGAQPHNPVPLQSDDGGFWDTLIRAYIDETDYWESPQVFGANLTSLFDRMRIYYEEPPHDIDFEWDSYNKLYIYGFDYADGPFDFPFTIVNNESFPIAGQLRMCYASSVSPKVFDSLDSEIINTSTTDFTTSITLPASGSWSGYVRITPTNNTTLMFISGVSFAPNSQLNDDANQATGDRNWTDSNVEKRTQFGTGPFDAWNWGTSHKIRMCDNVQPDSANNKFLRTAHGYVDGSTKKRLKIKDPTTDSFPTVGGSPAFSESTDYYIVNSTTDDFQLSTSIGGGPVTFDSNGTTTSGFFGIY